MDWLSLVEFVNGLCQGIIVTVALLPTKGSIPASAGHSLYLIETYCEPLSSQNNGVSKNPGRFNPAVYEVHAVRAGRTA